MNKKNEITIYPTIALFDDFFDDFSKELKLGKDIKKFIFSIFIVDLVYFLITIIIHFFKLNKLFISISLACTFLIITIIMCYCFFSKKRKKEDYNDIYSCFLRLLLKSKYSSLNSLTTFEEMNHYIVDVKSFEDLSIKTTEPILYSILSFLLTNLLSTIISHIAQINMPIVAQGMSILFGIIFSGLVLKKLYSITLGKDYRQSIKTILLFCIMERRLEIIKSSQKNIFEKIKYALRLGEYC